MRAKPYIFSLALFLAVWVGLSGVMDSRLMPSPWRTMADLGHMLSGLDTWIHIGLTVFRGFAGLAIAFAFAFIFGVPAGFSRRTMDLIGPLVAALQACPAIVWVTLLMVFVGSGSQVPVTVVAAALFPPLFVNVAQGTASLDPRLLSMARLFKASRGRVLRDLVIPGIAPFLLAGLSYGLATCWRVVAMAEFLAAGQGVGSRLYWSYRMLDMPRLFSWVIVLMVLGLGLEVFLVRPLRLRATVAKD